MIFIKRGPVPRKLISKPLILITSLRFNSNDPFEKLIQQKQQDFKLQKAKAAKNVEILEKKGNDSYKKELGKLNELKLSLEDLQKNQQSLKEKIKIQNDLNNEKNANLTVQNEVETSQSSIQKLNSLYQEYYSKLSDYYKTQKGNLDKFLTSQRSIFFENTKLLSKLINDITGYSQVDKIQSLIDETEKEVISITEQVKAKKIEYANTIKVRTETQKAINELLTKKHEWTPEDLENFTNLYRQDHSSDKLVNEAQKSLEDTEFKLESARNLLLKFISRKYHEEYLWNNKMKTLSTGVTVGLMMINILLLLISQFFFEPLKIQRILNKLEIKPNDDNDEKFRNHEVQLSKLHAQQEIITKQLTDITKLIEDKMTSDDLLNNLKTQLHSIKKSFITKTHSILSYFSVYFKAFTINKNRPVIYNNNWSKLNNPDLSINMAWATAGVSAIVVVSVILINGIYY